MKTLSSHLDAARYGLRFSSMKPRGRLQRSSSAPPGMDATDDVLLAVAMAIALSLVGTTTWLWALAR
jgi:hypothetical protein